MVKERCRNARASSQQEQRSSAPHITDLPTEVLVNIFQYCPYHEVAKRLRPSCERFRDIATIVLNSGFTTLGPRIDRSMVDVEFRVMKAQTENEQVKMIRAFNALEALKSQYLMLRAVTWRYVCNPFKGPGPLACFYGGLLIDKFLQQMWLLRQGHGSLYLLTINIHERDHEFSDFGHLRDLCRRFMDDFEKNTETKFNVNYSISGSKIVDLFDCLVEYMTVKPYEKAVALDGSKCHIKAHYRMRRSWFTCYGTSKPNGETTWNNEQRTMYLRLRRLITRNNEISLEQKHYERELILPKADISTMTRLKAFTYRGHGEHAGRGFYYGTMNQPAFNFKFRRNNSWTSNDIVDYYYYDDDEVDDDDDDDDDDLYADLESCQELSLTDLSIDIEVYCPIELAPIEYIENIDVPNFEFRYNCMKKSPSSNLSIRRNEEPEFVLTMVINCPESSENLVPSTFRYEIKSGDVC